MISIEKSIQSIAAKAFYEADRLLNNNIIDDDFIKSVASDLKILALSNQAPEDVYKRSSALGLASVRVYQSFDETPEAEKFVELCNSLSDALSKT